MMRALVLGGSGMLGHKLCQLGAQRLVVFAAFRRLPNSSFSRVLDAQYWRGPVIAEEFGSVRPVLDDTMPDVVINCVGVVKHLAAGQDPVATITANSLFPHLLARECGKRGIRLLCVSTDCVFSGRLGQYRETDPSDATDLYGRTKYLGEVSCPGCLTLRTSIVGREVSGSHGLIEWFLSQRGKAVRGFRRAVFSGLSTLELSRVIFRLITEHPELQGLYHVAAAPINKHDLLTLVRDSMELDIGIDADDSLVCDRSLDGSRFAAATGYIAPPWPEMIADMHNDPTPYDALRSGN